jgi:guanylate kinase
MNELTKLPEFEKVLDGYQPSAVAQTLLQQTKLILLVAATASGRNTIISELVKTGRYRFWVSDTTRAPRVNNGELEQDGREYWFRSEADLLHDLQQGELLEAEIIHGRQVSGLSIRELRKAHADNKLLITDADIGGVRSICRLKPDTMAVVVLPPSFKEWQRRIFSRGDMPPEEYVSRLRTAATIFQAAIHDDQLLLIVNNDLHDAVRQLDALAQGKTQVAEKQQAALKRLARELYDQTMTFLDNLAQNAA